MPNTDLRTFPFELVREVDPGGGIDVADSDAFSVFFGMDEDEVRRKKGIEDGVDLLGGWPGLGRGAERFPATGVVLDLEPSSDGGLFTSDQVVFGLLLSSGGPGELEGEDSLCRRRFSADENDHFLLICLGRPESDGTEEGEDISGDSKGALGWRITVKLLGRGGTGGTVPSATSISLCTEASLPALPLRAALSLPDDEGVVEVVGNDWESREFGVPT
jgi:hypothetical protein